MKRLSLKFFAHVLSIILCACCLSACVDDDSVHNTSTIETVSTTSTQNTSSDNTNEETSSISTSTTTSNVDTTTTSESIQSNEESKPNVDVSSKVTSTTSNNTSSVVDKNVQSKTESGKTSVSVSSKVTTSSKQQSTTASKPSSTSSTPCNHTNTKIINNTSATCTNASYTGDTYCNDCNKVISNGTSIAATGHTITEIRTKEDATTTSVGYTGDTYCKQCGNKIASGQTIPKLDENDGKVEYIFSDGSTLWIEPDGDIIGTLMAQKTKPATHLYLEVEKEILRLCNIEREKEGLKPLTWFEDAYYFTQIRAEEASQVWSHTRPNGKNWYTVYNDAGVFLIGRSGENLFDTVGHSITNYAAIAVEGWMNSPGHRANILNPNFTRIAISIVQHDNQITAAQNFFS